MFRRLEGIAGRKVEFFFEDQSYEALEGDNLAAQMLILGLIPSRHAEVDGEPRAPHCMIGNCFECLVEIDGQPNRQACQQPVREGMRVRRQRPAMDRETV